MRVITRLWAFLLPFIIALAGCSSSPATTVAPKPTKAAHLYVIDDVSVSAETIANDVVAQAALRHVADEVKRLQLGDTITIYEAGARSAQRAIAHPPIVTDYKLRIPTASAMVDRQMREIAVRYRQEGGDGSTNLLLTLESVHPECSPRTAVVLVTDGVESSDAFAADHALAANQPVNLPPPSSKYLAGCRVVFLGFGLTGDTSFDGGQLLPARQLAALRKGWLTYLQSAGVRPEDIQFTSIL